MLCYALYGVGDLRAEERPTPTPGRGEALIKIAGCAVCHTDLSVIDGHFPAPKLPRVLGHEYAGTVAALGPATTAVKVGDRVTVYSTASCGLCGPCRRGTPWLCMNRQNLSGGYAEYATLPERCLFPVPPDVTDEQAISTNPFSIVVHAVELAAAKPGDSAMVVGAGAIGLVLVAMLRFSGAGTIIVSEPDPERRRAAAEFGADVALDPRACDLTVEVRRLTGEAGADVVFEVVGLPQTIEQSFTLVRRGGSIILVGTPSPDAEVRIRPYEVHTGHLTIRGSMNPWWTYPRAIELLPKVRPERVLTHRFPLSELPAALDQRRKNIGIKNLVVP